MWEFGWGAEDTTVDNLSPIFQLPAINWKAIYRWWRCQSWAEEDWREQGGDHHEQPFCVPEDTQTTQRTTALRKDIGWDRKGSSSYIHRSRCSLCRRSGLNEEHSPIYCICSPWCGILLGDELHCSNLVEDFEWWGAILLDILCFHDNIRNEISLSTRCPRSPSEELIVCPTDWGKQTGAVRASLEYQYEH